MSDQPTFYQKHQIDKQRQAKWEQMLAHLCDEYDLGPLSDLSDDRRQELEGELEEHVDQWNETEPVSGHAPSTTCPEKPRDSDVPVPAPPGRRANYGAATWPTHGNAVRLTP